jgi:hypothetical protein
MLANQYQTSFDTSRSDLMELSMTISATNHEATVDPAPAKLLSTFDLFDAAHEEWKYDAFNHACKRRHQCSPLPRQRRRPLHHRRLATDRRRRHDQVTP